MSGVFCASCGHQFQRSNLNDGLCGLCLRGIEQARALPPETAKGAGLLDGWEWRPHASLSPPAADPSDTLVVVAKRDGAAWGLALILNGRTLGDLTPAEARELSAELLATADLCEGRHSAMPRA